jgi:DNA-binding MarR family transcriptional regulator
MTIFEKLQQARLFRQRHLALLRTLHDLEIVWEIGLHQEAGNPLNIKYLSMLNLGPVATIRRRLRRLRALGLVRQRPSAADKRIKHLTLSAALKRRLSDYGRILVAA